MGPTTTITTTFLLLLKLLKTVPDVAQQVNQRCQEKQLPPAFVIEEDPFDIQGNPDYRLTGFGIVAGLTPKLSFWVHYKPDSPEHINIGRFLLPISLLELQQVREEFDI